MMPDLVELLADLRRAGITLLVEENRLHWRGPANKLTPERLAAVGYWKADILALWSERGAITTFDDAMPRECSDQKASQTSRRKVQ